MNPLIVVTNVSGVSRAEGTKGELGGFWHRWQGTTRSGKRFPQILDQWAGVRLGLMYMHCAVCIPTNSFLKACAATPAGVPGLCAETPTLYIFCECEQHTAFDLVEDTFMARF